ncbi:hypothetical protein CEXT_223051 [Caerostris extrusa]|uniref:Ribosomal protein L34 n=1 Tax=Caerostris extrusa TaxID=172846 RepID=A0AAV4W272_CAEEX|nr:hypothetical protein CEXT_223051 [Caerostris extrusa]
MNCGGDSHKGAAEHQRVIGMDAAGIICPTKSTREKKKTHFFPLVTARRWSRSEFFLDRGQLTRRDTGSFTKTLGRSENGVRLEVVRRRTKEKSILDRLR